MSSALPMRGSYDHEIDRWLDPVRSMTQRWTKADLAQLANRRAGASRRPPMTVGSLFAGIGGFDLGFERAGFEIKWQVEIDPFCRAVLAKHWPDVRRYEDVRTVVGWGPQARMADAVRVHSVQWLDEVDVIVGGFPCKQTSVAAAITGRRLGLAGVDSGLWRHMLRIIGELQPRFCVVENPISDALATVSGDLANLGYGLSRYELEASDFGAPHLRRRVFLLADRMREGLAKPWPEGPSETLSGAWTASERNPWMQTLAGVLRVDDGVPGRTYRRERIEACGNAAIPQATEWIARRILDAEGLTS